MSLRASPDVTHMLISNEIQEQCVDMSQPRTSVQLEEELQSDLLWSILIKKVLHSGKSNFQSMELAESGPFGKVLPGTNVKIFMQNLKGLFQVSPVSSISR